MEEPSLDDARAKLDWAGKHLDALEARIVEFRKSRPYSVSLEGDVDTGEYLLTIRPHPLPKEIGLTIGDVIANLRGALDHLIYALAWLDSGEPQEGTQFPIADDAQKFESAKTRRLKGVSPEHIAAIESLQPYNGGETLAVLRDHSNTDKHMHLSLVGPQTIGDVQTSERNDDDGTGTPFGDLFPSAIFVHMDFEVALYEAFTEGRWHLFPQMQAFHAHVAQLLDAFEPEFEGR